MTDSNASKSPAPEAGFPAPAPDSPLGRERERVLGLLSLASPLLQESSRKTQLLGTIAWPRRVQEEFLASGGDKLPSIEYKVDRASAQQRVQSLSDLIARVDGENEIDTWIRRTAQSFIDGNRLLLCVGTRTFCDVSRDLYGGAYTRSWPTGPDNLMLATHVLSRMSAASADDAQEPSTALLGDEEFAKRLRERLLSRQPRIDLEVEVDDDLTAKIQAGRSRVRIRRGATFTELELDNLWSHEVETHALCAQNGSFQPHVPFLAAGGPRSTRTQEGLATFVELYDHDLPIERMRELANRVRLVAMAEDGASFIDLYRRQLSEGRSARDAYLDAQRVCRGGVVSGGAPFTKDVCYLGGLFDVYTYLSHVVRAGFRDEAELLVAGRSALEDMPALLQMRRLGLLAQPHFIPPWLKNWRGLLPYFAFTSFLSEVDLAPIQGRYARVIELATDVGSTVVGEKSAT